VGVVERLASEFAEAVDLPGGGRPLAAHVRLADVPAPETATLANMT
jgi:hypothetical protein